MLKIRAFEPKDAEKIVSWFNIGLSFYQWSAGRLGTFPITAQNLTDYYGDNEKCDGATPFVLADEDGVAGHFIIRFSDSERKHARLGFIVVDSARRGQGLGGRMLSLAVDYCKNVLNAESITLGVFENNPAAVRCYEKAGFVRVAGSDYETEIAGEIWRAFIMEHPVSTEKQN